MARGLVVTELTIVVLDLFAEGFASVGNDGCVDALASAGLPKTTSHRPSGEEQGT